MIELNSDTLALVTKKLLSLVSSSALKALFDPLDVNEPIVARGSKCRRSVVSKLYRLSVSDAIPFVLNATAILSCRITASFNSYLERSEYIEAL